MNTLLLLWQVHFSRVQDCLPLADEKTRDVLRDNFSQKGKFDCELSPNQVPMLVSLCEGCTWDWDRSILLQPGLVFICVYIYRWPKSYNYFRILKSDLSMVRIGVIWLYRKAEM
jgi:hypothetical protein